MAKVYLALGANLGDRAANLKAALAGIAALPETRLLRSAGVYETRPVGGPEGQGDYYNSACLVETELSPREMLSAIHRLERDIGRRRDDGEVRWGPRVIDIDILLWEDLIQDEADLTLPHPRMAGRAFVLLPLAELAPDALHPTEHATIGQLLERIGSAHEGIRRISL